MPTILVTGFGPFPSARFNPTIPLVTTMARARRPALIGTRIVTHVFPTGYAAVDRDLPKLIARHRPDALLMFGLAGHTKTLRVETRARNTLMHRPDASGRSPLRVAIALGKAAALMMPASAQRLLAALRTAHVPARLSHDAGRYLCNYLCWRAAETVRKQGGPRLAAFVHVPKIARGVRRPGKRRRLSAGDLARAGSALLAAVACHVSVGKHR